MPSASAGEPAPTPSPDAAPSSPPAGTTSPALEPPVGFGSTFAPAAPTESDTGTQNLNLNINSAADTSNVLGYPAESAGGGGINWSGYFRNETAYRYDEPRSLTKLRSTVFLKGTHTFNANYSMTFSGWAYYDAVYDLYDYDTIAGRTTRNSDQPLAFLFNLAKKKDSQGADLREMFLDMSYDKLDVRLGRQFVVWGVLEGVRIVDEVQPIDFRELILPDLLDYRIPSWMAKVDYFRDEGTYELLYIPDIQFHKPAPPGSEWELLQAVPGAIAPERFNFLDPEIGLRFSTRVWDADITFSYLYTYDQFPTVFRRILLNQVQIAPEFDPTYSRINMYGSTISAQVGEYILKGEVAYVTGKYFSVVDIDRNNDGYLDSLGEFRRNHVRWGAGVETNIKGMDVSLGVTQWIILDYDPAIVVDNYDTSFNLFLRKEFAQSSTGFEFLGIDFVNFGELYFNPRMIFMVTDRFKITTGVNLFYGRKSQFGVQPNPLGSPIDIDQRSQFVGNFSGSDQVYIDMRYSF